VPWMSLRQRKREIREAKLVHFLSMSDAVSRRGHALDNWWSSSQLVISVELTVAPGTSGILFAKHNIHDISF